MSKTKIIAGAGVAALAIAAIPAAFSFAATTQDVEYEVVISETLELAVDDADLSYTLTNGGAAGTGQASVFTATTNHSSGYQIVATDADTDLTNATSDTIAYGTPAQGTSAWNLTTNGSNLDVALGVLAEADLEGDGALVHKQNTPTSTTGVETAVSYSASAASNQAAGTYTDTVRYTVSAI